jgi:hypothetical protein
MRSQANSKNPFAPRCEELRRNVADEVIGGMTWCEYSHFGEVEAPWIMRVRVCVGLCPRADDCLLLLVMILDLLMTLDREAFL